MDRITDASGNSVKGNKVGKLRSVISDKYGNEEKSMTIKAVVHMPGSKFNLFSIAKRLEEGWKLFGDSNKIWIENGHDKITFDIKIKTPKGAILFFLFFHFVVVSR